jgi:NADH dehydrogenase
MRIYIVGGGFAGISAAKELSKTLSMEHEISLINKYDYTTMLPNLPEITSGRFEKRDITEAIVKLIPSRVKFILDEVKDVNFEEKKITAGKGVYSYDYLIMASGSKTNFYGFSQNVDKINVLESLEAAESIKVKFRRYMENRQEGTLVVSGAGFTGIELACNLYDYCKRQNKKLNVIFVELAKRVLPMLSEKSTAHVIGKLDKLGFKIYTENQIVGYDGKDIILKSNEIISDVFFCWCSGVKSSLKPMGQYQPMPDGRIAVNEFLQVPEYPEVYAAGDAAAIKDKNGSFLRRAVTFAQMSGKHAAKNLAAAINKQQLKAFSPIDLGWIIPIYISSIGVALGVDVKGRKGIFMHYILCGIKNYNLRNFLKALGAAVKYPFASYK